MPNHAPPSVDLSERNDRTSHVLAILMKSGEVSHLALKIAERIRPNIKKFVEDYGQMPKIEDIAIDIEEALRGKKR